MRLDIDGGNDIRGFKFGMGALLARRTAPAAGHEQELQQYQ